jgi:uncharacterized phage protein (TIGR02218 family)
VKTLDADLQTNYSSGAATTAYALKITRTDAEVFRFTSGTKTQTISGIDSGSYLAIGFDVLSFVTSAGFGVDNTEITALADDTYFTTQAILEGRWNNAAWQLWRYDHKDTTTPAEPMGRGTLGEFRPKSGAYVAELRGLQQYLQQSVGAVSSKTCRARLGDSMCTVTLATFTEEGEVTHITDNRAFRDSARTEDLDWYSDGVITWLTGNNTGLSYKIKTFDASGNFVLSVPTIAAIQVGDTYSAIAGCRKRLTEDCIIKFDNVLNFQGEPHRPTIDELTSAPEVNV